MALSFFAIYSSPFFLFPIRPRQAGGGSPCCIACYYLYGTGEVIVGEQGCQVLVLGTWAQQLKIPLPTNPNDLLEVG